MIGIIVIVRNFDGANNVAASIRVPGCVVADDDIDIDVKANLD